MPLLACPAVLFRENSRSLLDKPAVAPFSSTRHSKFDKALELHFHQVLPQFSLRKDGPGRFQADGVVLGGQRIKMH